MKKTIVPQLLAIFPLMMLSAVAQTKPSAPRAKASALAALSAIPVNQHGAELTWTPAADGTDTGGTINVYKGTVVGTANACGALTLLTSGISLAGPYDDTAVSAGTTVCYAVSAQVNGIESAKSNTASGTALPFAPTGTTAQANGKNVVLNWTASVDGGGVNVYRANNSAGPFTLLNSVATGTTYTDTTAPSGNVFYYLTAVVNTVEGKPTTVITAQLAPSAPSLTVTVQ